MNKSLKTGALLVGAGVAAGGLSGIGALVLAAELVRPGRVRSV
jgi:hypothetical protein